MRVMNEQALPEQRTQQLLQQWAEGKATLKDVRGYSDEELYAIAKAAYFFFYQGRIDKARTLFMGLYAINPVDPYFAKALGVVEMAAKNPAQALAAYDVAIKLAPQDAGAWLGRAEVKLAMGQKVNALDDLRRAQQVVKPEDPISPKISAMLAAHARK